VIELDDAGGLPSCSGWKSAFDYDEEVLYEAPAAVAACEAV